MITNKIENLFKEATHFSSYNNEIQITKKDNTILLEIPGYKYMCSFCQSFIQSLKENLEIQITEEKSCAGFEKSEGIDYTKSTNHQKIVELKKKYL